MLLKHMIPLDNYAFCRDKLTHISTIDIDQVDKVKYFRFLMSSISPFGIALISF